MLSAASTPVVNVFNGGVPGMGDPVTVKVQVEGEGNFDRVRMPVLSDASKWKTYPSTNEFVAADAIGSAGVKMFEQVMVPQTPDINELPALELVYFDTKTRTFETAKTEAIKLEVTGEAIRGATLGASEGAGGNADTDSALEGAGNGAPEIEGAGAAVLVQAPLYAQGWFLVLLGGVLVTMMSGMLLLLRRRMSEDVSGRAAQRALRRELATSVAEMDRAIACGDVARFFGTLRRVMQAHAGRLLGMDAAAVTAADVRDVEIQEILKEADAISFSGAQSISVEELLAWKGRAMRVLETRC
jgi:hypothetical protein